MNINTRTLGIVFILFAIIIAGFTTWLTDDLKKLNSFLHKDCTLPADVCPFNTLVPPESMIGFSISIAMAAFGVFLLIISRKETKGKLVESKKIEDAVKMLTGDEKTVYDTIVASQGTIFQSELVEKSGLDKVRVSRVLDKLEGRGLIERKRRGMSNVIVLRH
ncbi:MAG TPA: MarR family transcriptional regulator [archaeon]|nr:MarR family transcriptional regulator [archaeon]